MGTSGGGSPRLKAEMNMTPMIDVLLVLIIIFMLISPRVPVGLEAQIPHPADQAHPAPAEIVITVHADGTVQLNQESMNLQLLKVRLSDLFRSGSGQTIFLRGEKSLEFASVAQVIDLARGVGVYRVGLMTDCAGTCSLK